MHNQSFRPCLISHAAAGLSAEECAAHSGGRSEDATTTLPAELQRYIATKLGERTTYWNDRYGGSALAAIRDKCEHIAVAGSSPLIPACCHSFQPAVLLSRQRLPLHAPGNPEFCCNLEFYCQLDQDNLYEENHVMFPPLDEHTWLLQDCTEIRLCREALDRPRSHVPK